MKKIAENHKISLKFGVSRQILDKIGVQLFENLQSERHFNKLSHVLFSWKTLVWFLGYVILKFTMFGFPLKIVNLPF